MLKGSCLCGAVRYEVSGQIESFYLCHCTRCRKATGSAHAANLFSTTARVRWISGENVIGRFSVPNTKHSRSFCKQCGSPVPTTQMEGALWVVPAGGLDGDVPHRPNAHIFGAERAAWDLDLDSVHTFDALPE